ncbi:GGDEF domain-containing protein [Ferribacterium limneticum]|uniref:GGDEF domain-containing protein n=1 Tax=Ferribacterium limneticum TaxID=76259 RepID=UPI001CFC3E6F|nr:diguanylate cyclase [Ferribacterium limneticum]UCV27999.1 diguanylate cyclase [Ferribacterium limneticum]UCV31916.1 diguanylate cyclase [Ferribacterium limneticum]
MQTVSHSFIALAQSLELRWQSYRESGDFDQFIEFTLSLNGLTERLGQQNLPGLASACEELEHRALALFNDSAAHPVTHENADAISQQLNTILRVLQRHETPAVIAKRLSDKEDNEPDQWIRQRKVLIVSRPEHPWAAALVEQLSFYGFKARTAGWDDAPEMDEPPLAAILIPDRENSLYPPSAVAALQRLKASFVTTYFYCLSVPSSLEAIVGLQRAGANVCIPAEIKLSDILSRILDLVESREQETHRVLIVEDSRTAVAHIQRALDLQGIDSRAINTPLALLQATSEYRPHAILMDMYMPFCTGVEVTRALRQIPEYQSLPVIYLSGETDIAQQVEALRLGGDQFLTKPANPIILGSVVKTKIDRYRDMLRSGRHDGLTGLLNHSASKEQLGQMLRRALPAGHLAVAMIDIDRFKLINDNYGHPVGDQVIRSLAWLLRGRLRNSDLIGRYGGEEFIVALNGVELSQAITLLDRIRHDFSQLPHAHSRGALRASFSCGVASVPSYLTGSSLIEAADEALLQAKREGRNQIIAAGRKKQELSV